MAKTVKKPKEAEKKTGKAIPSSEQANTNDTHDSRGKFTKGNQAARGHSTKQQTKAIDFKVVFQNAITNRDMVAIAKKMVKLAKKGDIKAAKEVLDRCMGKPPQTHEVGGIGGEPIPVSIVDFGKIKIGNDNTE